MFWADSIAKEIQKRNFPLEWVDDMKTPSGRIHVGSLRGVIIHDLIYKCLLDIGVKAKYTYVFDNHDPMDGLPVYLPKEFEKYLGLPLFKVPSPQSGFDSFAAYFAAEFKGVFNEIGATPEIIWASELYSSGKMNDAIKEALDDADNIREIYEKIYKKKIAKPWYPFQPYCESCGKVSTTTVTNWDGKQITYSCEVNKVNFTLGCGHNGKMSPFSSNGKVVGKLPWKVEWAAKWKIIGVTVEGAGKDHMTAGGSHTIASAVSKKVYKYPVPYPLAYEWFILGKAKMSTSKGVGASAIDMLNILPPQLLRFLMVRTRINSEINFDLSNAQTIPALFDEYQRCARAYFSVKQSNPKKSLRQAQAKNNSSLSEVPPTAGRVEGQEDNITDLARIFELSQINKVEKSPSIRFSVLAQWIQMPNMQEAIKTEKLEGWVPYAKYWLEHFAPESERFFVQENLPESAKQLSNKQKALLKTIVEKIDAYNDAEKLQLNIYEWGKALGLSGKEVFSAIYQSLIGKDHGPKAAWLILSLDKSFVKKRFLDIAGNSSSVIARSSLVENDEAISKRDRHAPIKSGLAMTIGKEIFSIDPAIKDKFPSVSVGVAIIKGVTITKSNPILEKEKKQVESSLESLTTEQLGMYPEVLSYRKLYKEMGIDWHSRRPSPEALLRRIALKKGLYTINTCVDAYNLVVMRNRVSIGAFDLDAINFPTMLRFAKPTDEILLLGDQEATNYTEKEVAYFDQVGGFNMDFNYRDAQRTAVQLATKNILVNVDGIFDITPEKVQKSLQEACDMIIAYCGGKLESFGVMIP